MYFWAFYSKNINNITAYGTPCTLITYFCPSNNSEARGESVPFQGHINEQVVEQAFGLEQP